MSKITTIKSAHLHAERAQPDLSGLDMYLVGYLWFQQLFWKLPPAFAGLYGYIVRESQRTILPGYGALLQHTFLAGCSSPSSPVGCTAFVPLAACVWTAELLVAISLLFGLLTRFGAILATILSIQLYVGLAYTEWIWTYGMLVLLALVLVAVPAGHRLGGDRWLVPRRRRQGSAIAVRSPQAGSCSLKYCWQPSPSNCRNIGHQ